MESSLALLLQEISQYPLLTKEQELELVEELNRAVLPMQTQWICLVPKGMHL